MKKLMVISLALLGVLLLTSPVLAKGKKGGKKGKGAPAAAATGAPPPAGWQVFVAKKYGYSMLIPAGANMIKKNLGDNWGGMYASHNSVEFLGLAKMGVQATPADIKNYAITTLKIPAASWKLVDKGVNASGWTWWETYEATNPLDAKVIFAVFGTGKKGSYLLFIGTTKADFLAKRAVYDAWYRSLTLF